MASPLHTGLGAPALAACLAGLATLAGCVQGAADPRGGADWAAGLGGERTTLDAARPDLPVRMGVPEGHGVFQMMGRPTGDERYEIATTAYSGLHATISQGSLADHEDEAKRVAAAYARAFKCRSREATRTGAPARYDAERNAWFMEFRCGGEA